MANILYHVDAWAGRYNAGSESMNNTMAKYLASKGHFVHVLTNPTMADDQEERDGLIFFTKVTDAKTIEEQYAWADFVVTSIAFTPRVNALCKKYNKRLIYVIHNNHSVPFWEVKPDDVWLAVYNADWIKKHHNEKFKWVPEREMTMYPPVLLEEYQVEDGEKECISLVNLSLNKGVLTLIQAAKMMPEYKFLAVKGGYGDQVLTLPKGNVELVEHTSNITQDVYRRSKLIMMPSKKETWGMVAIEAMCSGIPVLAHPTEGLVEACGDAGIFIIRDKAYLWESQIKRLMEDDEYYALCSAKCKERAQYLSDLSKSQLEEWERIISENSINESIED